MTHELNSIDLSRKPQSKAELIERIRQARAALEQTIAPLDDETLTRPGGPDGWAVKDHLAHLVSWQRKLIAILQGRPPYEGLLLDQATYLANDMDELNEIIYERNKDLTLTETMVAFRQTYEEMLAIVADQSKADLARPYVPDDPTETRRVLDGIIDNSYEHDLEHQLWIEQLLESHRSH
jgi:hypothetical protein